MIIDKSLVMECKSSCFCIAIWWGVDYRPPVSQNFSSIATQMH